jgi:hypothetical protein
MGTVDPFPEGEAQSRLDADHSPHEVLRSWMSRSYTSSLPAPPQVFSGKALPFHRDILRCEAWIVTRIDCLWWGETMSQNCGHQQHTVHPSCVMWALTATVMMTPAGDNSWLLHQNSLTVLSEETSGASRRNGRKSENFSYQYLKYLQGFLTFRKILRHGTSGFTYHSNSKEGVLRILSPLKIHRLGRVWTRIPWVQWQAH